MRTSMKKSVIPRLLSRPWWVMNRLKGWSLTRWGNSGALWKKHLVNFQKNDLGILVKKNYKVKYQIGASNLMPTKWVAYSTNSISMEMEESPMQISKTQWAGNSIRKNFFTFAKIKFSSRIRWYAQRITVFNCPVVYQVKMTFVSCIWKSITTKH